MAIEKADVIALLNKLKGAPAMIIFTEGTRMYTGIDDFYLFAGDKQLVQVCKNANPYEGTVIHGMTQQDSAYKTIYGDYDDIAIIISFKGNTVKDVLDQINGLTPIGTELSINDIKKKITTDPLFGSNKSAYGFTREVPDVGHIELNVARSNMSDRERDRIEELLKNQ